MRLVDDVRLAIRYLRHAPGHAATAAVVWQTDTGGQAVVELTYRHQREWSGDGSIVGNALRHLARELDPRSIVDQVTSMDAVVRRAPAPWRLATWMFVLFGALAFGLAALGLFSLVALDVAQRGREFAVRMALGAPRGAILRGVLSRAGRWALAGVALGLLVAVLATRSMSSLLFQIAPGDLLTYVAVLAAVVIVVVAAAYFPARRAVRSDPRRLLKQG